VGAVAPPGADVAPPGTDRLLGVGHRRAR
jgi:hypothetical protein